MEYFSRTTIPALSVSFSVHESKLFFVLAVSALYLRLIYYGAGMVVHLLLLKLSIDGNDVGQATFLPR